MDILTPDEIRAQLHEVFESKDFQASPRLKDFLAFVVEKTLAAKGQDLKAYTIGVEVFALGKDFDPNTNPLVRTEAGRLRSKLEHFYLHNPGAKIKIDIPKGGYAAAFSKIDPVQKNHGSTHPRNKAYSFSISKVPQAEHKASIMLLPFSNINKTGCVDAIVEGLSSSMNIHLTKFRDLKIINYNQLAQFNSAFREITSKNLNVDTRFILCGSVQKDENIVEVHASLVDTTSMHNIWAEKFDAEVNSGSLFEVQESIAQAIVYRIADDFGLLHRTLLQEMTSGVSPASSIQEASLLYYHWTTTLTRRDFVTAVESVKKAHASDPQHVPTLAMLADLYASDHQWSYGKINIPLDHSLKMASKAANEDPSCQLAHVALALNYHLRADFAKFKFCAEKALELNPSSTNTISTLGSGYAMAGVWDKAFELTSKIMELSSTCPGWCHFAAAMHKYLNNDFENSLIEAQKINMPENLWDSLIKLAAGGFLGERAICEKATERLFAIYPDFKRDKARIVCNSLPYENFSSKILEGIAKAEETIRRDV